MHGLRAVGPRRVRLQGAWVLSFVLRPAHSGSAAHLIDHVLPDVPIRQWVLSLPHATRYLIGFDKKLCREVRGIFVRAVLSLLKRRARDRGIPNGESGAVVVTQRALDARIGRPPDIHGVVLVIVDGTTDVIGDRPVRVEGRLRVSATYEDGFCVDIFQLESGRVSVIE